MRIRKILLVVLMTGVLTACLGGLVARAGTDILLAILRPMVGLDPNSNGLFQQPVIRNRMQAFLGEKYEPVMKLIVTADQLQQEGPLYFVVSRYTPIPEIAEKAGFVWNAETNQMAVMLVTGGSPTVIAERVLLKKANAAVAEAVPQWPVELQTILDEDAMKRKVLEAASSAAANAAVEAVGVDPVLQQPLGDALRQQAVEQLEAEMRASEEAGSQP